LLLGDWPAWRTWRSLRARIGRTGDEDFALEVVDAVPSLLNEARSLLARLRPRIE
jgi:hypothetical protein